VAKIKVETEPVVPVVPKRTYHLSLPQEEMQFIFDVLYWGVVGGGARRGINSALVNLLNKQEGLSHEQPEDMQGTIRIDGPTR